MLSASDLSSNSIMHVDQQFRAQASTSSSRILDIPCKVCGDYSSGKHYNIFACDGCAGFFKRSIRRNRQYLCKSKEEGSCVIDKTHRNQCRACRLQKCQEAGMNKDAVQHERGPRNATLRRQQMTTFFCEVRDRLLVGHPGGILNLAMSKDNSGRPLIPPANFVCNPMVPLPRLPVLPLAPILPPPVDPTPCCESAAQLIFTNVQWIRSISAMTTLPMTDQLLLLEESWVELFVLGAAQFLPIVELGPLVQHCGALSRRIDHSAFLSNVQEFQNILMSIRSGQLDQQEYVCLRTICLFKTSFDYACSPTSPNKTRYKFLTDYTRISKMNDDAHMTLNKHIVMVRKESLRVGKVLLLLPFIRNISGETIEELFFRSTIGNIPIVKIISDMYRSQSTSNQ